VREDTVQTPRYATLRLSDLLTHFNSLHTHTHTKESSKVDEVNEFVLVEARQVIKVRLLEHQSFCG